MSRWIEIGGVEDIPALGARVVKTPGGDVAVFRGEADAIFALEDRCPHKGGPLSQGIVHGTSVACPLHNWTIGLDCGTAKGPDHGCVPVVPIRLEAGRILLDLDWSVRAAAAE